MNDLKFALRQLGKSPAFTAIAVLTLALGIGANSAIFSVIDAMLLRSLPFKDPQQIVSLWASSRLSNDRDVQSYPNFVDLRERSRSFNGMAAFTRTAAVLNNGEDSQSLEGVAIDADVFPVLGVSRLIGRAYTREEDTQSSTPVVVLTYPTWRHAFGGNPDVIGQQISLSGRSITVIGVMPPGWKFPIEDEHIDYVIPLNFLIGANAQNRGASFLTIVARLKTGVPIKQAQAELSAISATLAKQYPDTNTGRDAVTLVRLHDDVVGNVRPALLILLGAVALVLFIACANVANLLLARAATRTREIAIRTALGASRALVVRQLLCESLLLALIGGTAGLLLAWWGVDVLDAVGLRGLPHIAAIKVNATVCIFALLLAVVSTVLFGLVPALQVSRASVNEALQQGAKGSTGGSHYRLRALLVISQVALSLLLLAGSGLLIKSFFNLRGTNPGFDPERVMTAQITLPRVRYADDEEKQIRAQQLIEDQLAAIPGIENAGTVDPLPLNGNIRASSFMVSGAPPLPPGQHPGAGRLVVSPTYFQTMKIPLISGRFFNRTDGKASRAVAMINQAFARKFFPDRDPLTQQVLLDMGDNKVKPLDIVGIVGNSHHDNLNREVEPEFYLTYAQDPSRTLDIVLRLATPHLGRLDATVKNAVHAVDKDLFVPTLAPMNNYLSNQVAQPRFNMILLAAFAGIAMLLAAIGIYGVIAGNVAQRTREIGIRMALGAQRTQMLQMILWQSITLVAVGLAIGFVAALAATRVMRSLLYGVGANDPSTYAIVFFLLGGTALFASYIPARRAMKVDPMIALRYE